MLFRLVVFCSIVTVGSNADAACKSCEDAVSNLFDVAQSEMAKVDPLALEDIQVCKILTVSGLKTINAYGTPCIKPTGKTEFQQTIGIQFDELHINCTLKLNELHKALKFSLPQMPEYPLIPPLPNKPKPDGLLADFNGLKLNIELKLDFENDVFDILSSTVAEIKMDALKIGCEGDGMIVTLCGLITKQKQIQSIVGYIAQYVVKFVIAKGLKTDFLKDFITTLYCGEPDPPDD